MLLNYHIHLLDSNTTNVKVKLISDCYFFYKKLYSNTTNVKVKQERAKSVSWYYNYIQIQPMLRLNMDNREQAKKPAPIQIQPMLRLNNDSLIELIYSTTFKYNQC